jgi:hypothetical protein
MHAHVFLPIRSLLVLAFIGIFCSLAPGVGAEEKVGYFEITSVPEGGDVFIGSQYMGETPLLIPARNQTEGTRIRVMMQGFEIWEQTIAGRPAPGQVVPVKAVLIPVSPFGTLEVTSSPSGALVTVDNGMGQMTPWTYQGISTGPHLISLFLSGFEPYVTNIDVLSGQVTRLHANMTVRSGAGSLQVSTDPGGASVYVDGVFSGTTNTVIGNIPPGKHRVLITKAGYEDHEEWVVVSNRQLTTLSTVLTPLTHSITGALVITSDPPGASVFLDDQFKGTTETGRPLELTGISPGNHTLYVSMRNYEDYSTTVHVTDGETVPISARLAPSPMPQDCGKLILNTDPSGAEIYLDGTFVGVSPATIDTVCSGKHSYRLILSGYEEYSSTVELISGQVLQVNTVLIPKDEKEERTPGPGVPIIMIVLASVVFLFSRRK